MGNKTLYDLFVEISKEHDSMMIGDWNLASSSSGRGPYLNLFYSDLIQCLDKPTRYVDILDLVLATNEDTVDNIVFRVKFSTSEHWQITFEVALNIALNINQYNICEKKNTRFSDLQIIMIFTLSLTRAGMTW